MRQEDSNRGRRERTGDPDILSHGDERLELSKDMNRYGETNENRNDRFHIITSDIDQNGNICKGMYQMSY